MQKRPKFKISSNLKEVIAYEKAHPGNPKETSPEAVAVMHLYELIERHRRSVTDHDSILYCLTDTAEVLFDKMKLEDGVKEYQKMLKFISIKILDKHHKILINNILKLISYMKKDEILDAMVDENLLMQNAKKNKEVMHYLIEKYETVLTES